MTNPFITTLAEQKLVGKRARMSLAHNTTPELWRDFMPRRQEIPHAIGPDLFSMQVYDSPAYFESFDPLTSFEKWAAVAVSSFSSLPETMEAYILPDGLYAVFTHRGAANSGEVTFRFIFETWLPDSAYVLDHRPHFELLGAKYRNNDPTSEEEIWIPIRPRGEAG